MPPVKPPEPKHTSQHLGDRLLITIPSPKFWFLTVFLGIWTIVWLASEIFFIGLLLFGNMGPDAPPVLVLVIWLALWTLGGAFAVYSFAWQVSGKELIQVTRQGIITRRYILGLGATQEYTAEHIRDLRAASSSMNLNHPMMAWSYSYGPWQGHMGTLAFDYGARTFRFGVGIDEAEAKQIVAEIQEKFPQYRSDGFRHS
jgi:hypothetical protein